MTQKHPASAPAYPATANLETCAKLWPTIYLEVKRAWPASVIPQSTPTETKYTVQSDQGRVLLEIQVTKTIIPRNTHWSKFKRLASRAIWQ